MKTQQADQAAQPMRADARRSHARLITAATQAFAEKGAGAPLDDIARKAGVGIGTLYRHFPTRLSLQSAVFKSQVDAVCAQADNIEASTPEQAFAGWIQALAGYLATKRGLSQALIDSLGRDSELIQSCWTRMLDTADKLLRHAQAAGVIRPDVTSQDVMRLVHGVAMITQQTPEDAGRLLAIVLDGLRAIPTTAKADDSRTEC
jgi:AcrR family transcriptional regulator